MNDSEAIRERHNYAGHFCAVNGRTLWVVPADLPCDTRVVLDALDETMADRDERASRHLDSEYDLITRLITARADADRLASALRAHWNARCEEWDDRDSDALRQHDKAAEVVA